MESAPLDDEATLDDVDVPPVVLAVDVAADALVVAAELLAPDEEDPVLDVVVMTPELVEETVLVLPGLDVLETVPELDVVPALEELLLDDDEDCPPPEVELASNVPAAEQEPTTQV
ncbi:MAG: hypothetical protein AB2A00_21300 [Myxococcota bacterium]